MERTIARLCKYIENSENIRILFAVENGSRAWRLSSKDSDFDVRFVFVRDVKEYLKINKPVDVITYNYDKDGIPCSEHDKIFIDIVGFDLFKFCTLLHKSNPTCMEWLISDIVYYGEQNKVFREFAVKHFNPSTLFYHYKSMCKNNYLKYLKSHNLVTYKKYLYAFRGLINAKWVITKKTIPPIIFTDALDDNEMRKIIPKEIIGYLKSMIELKKQGKEKDIITNIPLLDHYIEDFIHNEDDLNTFNGKTRQSAALNMLNNEIQNILLSKH